MIYWSINISHVVSKVCEEKKKIISRPFNTSISNKVPYQQEQWSTIVTTEFSQQCSIVIRTVKVQYSIIHFRSTLSQTKEYFIILLMIPS